MPDLDAAIEAAAALLSKSTLPVIAGLQTDVAGAIAAVKLARQVGGVVDHAAAEAALRQQAVMQDAGLMLISPDEALRVADTVLIVGDEPIRAWPDLREFFSGDADRKIVALSGDPLVASTASVPATHIACATEGLPAMVAALRARVNGRPVAASFNVAEVDRLAAIMKAARFGVVVWSPDELDELTIEMLAGLIKNLNEKTRWSGLPVSSDLTVACATAACNWIAGLPLRTSFARAEAEHDPWLFSAQRLVELGEADAVIWIGENPPAWLGTVDSIVLGNAASPVAGRAKIKIEIGVPGVDHDSIFHDRVFATLVSSKSSAPSAKPSAAQVLTAITARLDLR